MPWDCSLCGERFENQEGLGEHLRKKHRNKVKLAIFEHPLGQRPRSGLSNLVNPQMGLGFNLFIEGV